MPQGSAESRPGAVTKSSPRHTPSFMGFLSFQQMVLRLLDMKCNKNLQVVRSGFPSCEQVLGNLEFLIRFFESSTSSLIQRRLNLHGVLGSFPVFTFSQVLFLIISIQKNI